MSEFDQRQAVNALRMRQCIADHTQLFPQHLAEQFPTILQQMIELWPQPERERAYFQQLLVTQREARQGFPPAVHAEIFALSE